MHDTQDMGIRRETKMAGKPVATHDTTQQSEMQRDDPTHEEIAARAYQCWQERGDAPGSPEADWQQAEQELRAERARTGQRTQSAAASG